jgi:antitoxin CptB
MKPPEPSARLDARRKRLLFRAAHRGTAENDILIGGYVAANIAVMDAAALDQLERILEMPDVDLADWLTGRRPVPGSETNPLLHRMRAAAGRRAKLALATEDLAEWVVEEIGVTEMDPRFNLLDDPS